MAARQINSWLMDMDGVLVHEEQAIAGAEGFIARLREREIPFLVLTNNSIYTRRDLAARLRLGGLDVPEQAIWTSALATARFLESQRPILVLTGVTSRAASERHPYRASRVVESIADLIEEIG